MVFKKPVENTKAQTVGDVDQQMVQCGILNGVPESNVPTQICQSCGSSTSMTFPPHKLVQVGGNHAFMDTFHPLKLRLNPVPVGLGMLGVNTSSRVYKMHCDSQLYAVQQVVGVGRGCMLPIHHCEQLSQCEHVAVL